MFSVLKYIFISLFVLCFYQSSAYNIYFLNQQNKIQEVKLAHYCDSSERKNINEIQNLDFKKFTSGSVNLAYTNLPHWFAFSYYIDNSNEDYYLHFENPLLDSIEVYFIQNNQIIQKLTLGDHYHFEKRNYDFPDLLLKLPNKAQQVIDVYIKIKCEISLLSPIKIYTESSLISEFNELSLGTGIYYGSLIVIFFYSLFIYISLKDRAYLFYILYLLFYGLSLFNFDGYMFKYLLPDLPKTNNLTLYVSIYLATIFGTLFAVSFLELKKTWHFGYLLITRFLIPVIICLILIFLYPDVKFHDIASSILAAILSLIGIIVGVVSWKKGYPSAKYYFFAYTFVLSSVIIYVLKDLGFLTSNTFTEYIMHFGSGIEMILLSLGLADKYNKFKESNEQAQVKIIENLKEIQILQNQTNQELEEKVNIRTQQLNEQKLTLEEKQKEILDSITYAKRLQEAILPSKKLIDSVLNNNFIFYRPKDIVAGDFYWFHYIQSDESSHKLAIIAAADCTGHGVPGAMVSVVCSNALNRTVTEFNISEPGKILDKVRELVIETFEKSDQDVKDGMDISLCAIEISDNPQETNVYWSGANNALWLVKNKFNESQKEYQFEEIKPNKQAIGKVDKPAPFTTHQFKLKKDDMIYLFTDGLSDQFGGENGKKLKASRLKEFLFTISEKPVNEQYTLLSEYFDKWKGSLEQVDDVCLIGIKF